MDVAVVILNWNGKAFLEQFLPALVKYTNNQIAEIVVADNASTDDSVKYMQECFPSIRLILLDDNYGFAGGYNRALKQIKSKYYILLNSDVEVSEGWIEPMYEMLETDDSIAACQPKILSQTEKGLFEYAGAAGGMIDKYGFPFCRGRLFDNCEEDTGQYDDPLEIFWATGACLFVRSDLYWEAGGLDDDFFAHMEEIDLCWRMKLLDYKIMCQPSSVVFHVGGGTLNASNPFKTYLNFRNNLSLLYKNLPEDILKKRIFTRKLFDGIAALKFILSGKIGDFKAVLKAHSDYKDKVGDLESKRKKFTDKQKQKVMQDLYSNSVVLGYFARKKKVYKDYFPMHEK